MSFSLWTVACGGASLKWIRSSRPKQSLGPGGMLAQSTDGSVLRLHSCRALSHEPQRQANTRGERHKMQRRQKKTGLRFIQSMSKSIEPVKPEDQQCNWKLSRVWTGRDNVAESF